MIANLALSILDFSKIVADVPSYPTGFRTDVEISRASQPKRERELQAWQPDPTTPEPSLVNATTGQRGDDVTFGPNAGGSWDQFAVNEEMFGITTKFDEHVYTTKLDRSGKDYKEKEKMAERIAAEINGVSSTPCWSSVSLTSDAPITRT